MIIAYGRVLDNGILSYDDLLYLDRNEVKGGLTLDSVEWALTTTREGNYLPLPWLSFMLDVTFFGVNARAHHAINLLFHLLNSLLLLLVFTRMTGYVWRSTAVAALFALHPLHVESVAWIAEREDVLGGFFFAMTLFAYHVYVRRPSVMRYTALLLLFFLGLCSRQMLLTMPFLLLLLDCWPLNRSIIYGHNTGSSTSVPFRSLLIEKLPLIILMAIMAAVGLIVQRKTGTMISYVHSSLFENIANALVSYVKYIYKTVVPLKLSVFYPFHKDIPLWKVMSSAVFLLTVSLTAIRLRRSLPYLTTGWFWFLGTLVPAIGVIRLGDQAMADRYTYIPLTGLFIIAVWGVADMAERWRQGRRFILGAIIIMIGFYGTLTWKQTGYWRNTVTLFSHAANVTEDNWVALENLGSAYAKQGDFDRGLYYLQEALRIEPQNSVALANLGTLYNNLGNHELAISHYIRALQLNPRDEMAHFNLGLTLATAKGDIYNAMSEYRILMELNPEKADFLLRVIDQYEQMQRRNSAQ